MQSSAGRNFGQVIRFSCQAVIKAPFWKEPKYEGLRGLLQKPVAKPVCEKSDTGVVSIQCARHSLVETSTGKLIAE